MKKKKKKKSKIQERRKQSFYMCADGKFFGKP